MCHGRLVDSSILKSLLDLHEVPISVRTDYNIGLEFYLEIRGRKWMDSEFKVKKLTALF